MDFPRNKNLLINAKNLRKNMTPWERKLWFDFLRDYPVKIRRQEIIGNYIADFYCDKARLVIELDGSQHFDTKAVEKDKVRENHIKSFGIDILRYTNLEISQNFRGVCEDIDVKIKSRIKNLD